MAFCTSISLKLTNSQPHYVQVTYTEYHPDWPLNVESMGRSLFVPCKYSFHCFTFYGSCSSINFCAHVPY